MKTETLPSLRKIAGLSGFMAVFLLATALQAAEPPKKHDRNWTPGADDATVGALGAHRGGSSTDAPGTKVNRNAAPPAPIAAPALPKVDAGAPVISGPPTVVPSGQSPSPGAVSQVPSQPGAPAAAPRPEAHVEGLPGSPQAGASLQPAQPQQVNTFLANHLAISGFIAGLIGSDLGSRIYGGPMMGDETAALGGFICRVALVLLVAILAVRLIWALIGGRREADDFGLADPVKREPSFSRPRRDAGGGRREPSFGGDPTDRPGRH